MLKHTKTIEEILNAPANAQNAMTWYLEYRDSYTKLNNDIIDRFNYPSLWAAIDRLLYFREKEIENYNEMKAAGYTINDAFALHSYYEREENNNT